MSEHLSQLQLNGLKKVGEVYIEGCDSLPAFSKTQALSHVDRIAAHMDQSDLKDLQTLLSLFGFLPSIIVRLFLGFLEKLDYFPESFFGILRMMRMGLRGLVFSLYYGSEEIHEVLEYRPKVYTEDLNPLP